MTTDPMQSSKLEDGQNVDHQRALITYIIAFFRWRQAIEMGESGDTSGTLPIASAPSAKAICKHFASRLADGADGPFTPLSSRICHLSGHVPVV
jgi:hypothetical protein